MPEEVLNIDQLLEDYVRERDAMVQRSAQGRSLNPDRVLAAVRETKAPQAPAAKRVPTTAQSHWTPNTEVFINTQHCLVINVELAGMKREDLEITIDGNRLLVSGHRPQIDQSGSKSSLLVTDIKYGRFESLIEIPTGYDLSQAKAAYQNGFLRMEVPKAQTPSSSLPPGFDVENVLRDYIRDRDRVAAGVVLKPEHISLLRLESATDELQKSPRRRWWEAARRSFLAMIGKAPKKEPRASISFPSEKEFKIPESREAMIELLGAYRPPLYSYLRGVGYESAKASELVEEFLAYFLDQNVIAQFQADRSKFRTFLLAVLKRFMTTRRQQQLPLASSQRMRLEAADRGGLASSAQIASAEAAFERQWSLTILNRAMTRLAQESAAANKTELFENLKDFLVNEPDGGYAALASKLGMQPNAVAVLVSRLRSRFRNLIREEIAHTVSNTDAIDEEIRHFHSVLGRQDQ